jgi:hypothetical protein
MSINLKKLIYSPSINPLVEPREIVVKRKWVRSGTSESLVSPETGEFRGVSAIHQIEEKDEQEFVKVFAAGVAAAYSLNKTSQRVFQAVLAEYGRTPMRHGFADAVELFWFDGGLSGRDVEMSEKTFQRGLKDLLEKGFLAPRTASSFWVNPALFFKGDRVRFIKEYVRKRSDVAKQNREKIESQRELELGA